MVDTVDSKSTRCKPVEVQILSRLPLFYMKYINFLYSWTLLKASHPKAKWFLAFVSFIESSIFPIPPDIILIPMILANKSKAFVYALICTISSVIGALVGYLIGAFLFETIGKIILESYGLFSNFSQIKDYYDAHGIWLVLGGGFTPFPYKLITIASGVFSLNIIIFILASVISRGGRFFLIALLLWYFGEPIKFFLEKHLGKLTLLFFFLLVLGFALLKLI